MRTFSIPALKDNYIHGIVEDASESTLIVDPAEAKPVLEYLLKNQLKLTKIFITHHHFDHIGGVNELKLHFPECEVYGYNGDAGRLPKLTHQVKEGSKIHFSTIDFEIWHLPGHTTGHIAYISQKPNIAFTGDILFGMGCGRLFEGNPRQMFEALQRLKTLNPQTAIYCTHEYTLTNGQFARMLLPQNHDIAGRFNEVSKLRENLTPTVPLTMATEIKTNPFLLCATVEEFAAYRSLRDTFQHQESP